MSDCAKYFSLYYSPVYEFSYHVLKKKLFFLFWKDIFTKNNLKKLEFVVTICVFW